MPTASDELRSKMEKMFGNPTDDGGPLRYLFSKGYTEERGMIIPPSKRHVVSSDEWDCISFLCDEWDYDFDPTADCRME